VAVVSALRMANGFEKSVCISPLYCHVLFFPDVPRNEGTLSSKSNLFAIVSGPFVSWPACGS
jgi:hypothetical protein